MRWHTFKKIRNDGGYWERIEGYIEKYSEAQFTHGLCPECLERESPDDHGQGG